MRRLLLETAERRAGRREDAVIDRDRPTEHRRVVVGGQRQVAIDGQVSVDEIAEGTAGSHRLPLERLSVGGGPMECNRVEAVAGPGIGADQAAEVAFADAVEVDRAIGGRICRVADAATGHTIPQQLQVVGSDEVHAVGTCSLNRVVLNINSPPAERRPEDGLIGAALEVVAEKFESAPGQRPRSPRVARVDPVITGARSRALQVIEIGGNRVDATELARTDVDRRRVDRDAVGERRPQAAVADHQTIGTPIGPDQRSLGTADVDRLGGEQNAGVGDTARTADQVDADPFIRRKRRRTALNEDRRTGLQTNCVVAQAGEGLQPGSAGVEAAVADEDGAALHLDHIAILYGQLRVDELQIAVGDDIAQGMG